MSYLNLPKGIPDFSKAVVSLWFKIPKESIDAARAAYNSDFEPALRNGIVPLLTFGPIVRRKMYNLINHEVPGPLIHTMRWHNAPVCDWEEIAGSPISTTAIQSIYEFTGVEFDMDPSFIGIDCSTGRAVLSVNIQMGDDHAALDGSWPMLTGGSAPAKTEYVTTGMLGDCPNQPPTHPSAFPPHTQVVFPTNTYTTTAVYESAAPVIFGNTPERFRTLFDFGPDETHGPEVSSDQWHHLLLSFDLGRECKTHGQVSSEPGDNFSKGLGTDSACRLWLAFDNLNLTKGDLTSFWPDGYGDSNAILTPNAWDTAGRSELLIAPAPFDDERGNLCVTEVSGQTIPSCDYTPEKIPCQNFPFGVPADPRFVDSVRHCEMAELQLFTGIAMDTGVVANRRAFIDFKRDDKGNPVPDKEGGLFLQPVAPKKTEELLGRRPDVLLHGSSKWIAGKNTGAVGVDYGQTPPAEKPGGQFKPAGIILKYKPDPSIKV